MIKEVFYQIKTIKKKIFFLAVLLFFDTTASFDLEMVADGVYVHYGKQSDSNFKNLGDIANIGFIVGQKSIAVIDTGGTPNIGKFFKKKIKEISNLPISHIIITHAHPDHFFGTEEFFNDDVQIIGHSKLKRALLNNFEFYKNLQFILTGEENIKKSKLILPNIYVEENKSITIDLGNRKIVLKAWKSGHTDNDLSVYDLKTRLFWSENVFVKRTPSIRASIKGWKRNLDEISKMDIEIIVPGHGRATTKTKALEPMNNYFNRILDETRNFHKSNGKLKEAQKKIAKNNMENWLLFDSYHISNVTKAYTELEWE